MSRHAHRPSTPDATHLRPHVPVVLMVLGIGMTVLAASAPVWWPDGAAAPRAAAPDHPPVSAPAPREAVGVDPRRALTLRGLRVLRRWDARRATAYAEGDPRRLRDLYTRGSAAGRRDRALLTRYAERRLVVQGVEPQIRSVAVTSHRPGRLRVEVQERYRNLLLQDAGSGEDAAAQPLGESRYRSRAVELRRAAGGWRVATVERA